MDGIAVIPENRRARRGNFDAQLDQSIRAAADWLKANQKPEGYWVGRLESNACMEAQWILCLWFMGLENHHLRPRLAQSLIETQREDGAWEIYHAAPAGDINTTVEAYAALRSCGYAASDPRLVKARDWIISKGGLKNVRVFTRYWLALIGEWPWEKTPNIPPEVIHFPNWFIFSIYNFAQWARATLMPIAVLSARRPSRPLAPENRCDDLFPGGREAFDYELPGKPGADFWDGFFRVTDKILHAGQSFGVKAGLGFGRKGSVKRALEWIIEHQDADGVWGGIQPPWIYSTMALFNEGYALDHPVVAKSLSALDDPRWRVDAGEATWIQASTSPVWDTILTLLALDDCHLNDEYPAEVEKAVNWVLDQQVLRKGDWSQKLPRLQPGGWAFEYKNYFYPDTDDTAVALIALSQFRGRAGSSSPVQEAGRDGRDGGAGRDGNDRARYAQSAPRQPAPRQPAPRHPVSPAAPPQAGEQKEIRVETAIRLALDWLIGMQCENGGWGAFDKDNDKKFLTKIPFCDFGEALDPPSVDVTAHIVEAFGKLNLGMNHPSMVRAIDYLKREQEQDGSWFGRWGVNYIYGTGAVLPALAAIGEDMTKPYVARAADWLLTRQGANGGWGESCGSYMDPALSGRGTPTASQTAWALMGLIAADRATDNDAIERGIAFLMERQKNGTWEEAEYTGTGFPGYGVGATIKLGDPLLQERLKQGPELSRAFMINYNLYRHYFPLMAMGRWRRIAQQSGA